MLKLENTITDKKTQEIIILPRGEHYIQHLDKTLNFNDKLFMQIIQSFKSENLPEPFFDANHKFEESFGDIIDLTITDAGLMAKIQLNEKGIEAVKGKTYKYISPAIHSNVKDTKGNEHEWVLVAVSLTNIPALQGSIRKLQDQIELMRQGVKKNAMEEKSMKNIALQLDLQPEVSENIILETVKKLQIELETAKKDKNEAISKNLELTTKLTEIENTVKEKEKMELENEGKVFVKECIEKGKIHPSQQDYFLKQYVESKQTIIELMSSVPEKKVEQITGKQPGNETSVIQLSNEDKTFMLKAGLNPEDKEDVEIHLAAKAKYKGGK